MGSSWATRGLLVVVLACAAVLTGAAAPWASPASALQSTGDGTWFWQRPQPQGNELSAVCFSDAATAWAVGGAGTLLKSADGGLTWTAQRFPVPAMLRDVTFVDAEHGWVVGTVLGTDYRGKGVAFSTSDGGATWQQAPAAFGEGLGAVSFVDARHGWLAGSWNELYRTSDGGASWVKQRAYGWVAEVEFADAEHGWVADGNGGLLRTTDGGAHWRRQPRWRGWTVDSLTFTDARHGWVVAWSYHDENCVFVTSDGGVHWRRRLASHRELVTGAFADGLRGFVYTRRGDWDHGGVFTTSDGGATWRERRFSADVGWASSAMSPGGAMVVVGQGILASSDAGDTWSSRQTGRDDGAEQLQFVDAATGWAVGDPSARTLLHTADGVSWRPQLVLTSGSIAAYRFVDADHGWLASRTGDVYRTADGGETWQRVARLAGWRVGAVSFADASHGWLVGRPQGSSRWRILATSDGGATWDEQRRVPVDTWQEPRIQALDAAHVWVAAGETLLRTADGGASWARGHVPGYVDAIEFVTARRGWIGVSVGCSPQAVNGVYVTADGGATWAAQGSATPLRYLDVHDVVFLDENEGWAVGGPRGGSILGPEMTNVAFHTTDGGATWQQLDLGLFDYCTSVAAVDAAHVWISSYGGILSTVDTAVDAAAPVTLDDGDGRWHNADVALRIWASDIGGSGLARTEYRIDGEGAWQALAAPDLLLQVGAAGLADGPHRVTYRSVDAAGNMEPARACTVKFDTAAPRPYLPRGVQVARGGTVTLPVLVRDAGPCAACLSVTIEIRAGAGRTVQTVTRALAANAKKLVRFRCSLPEGTYRYVVSATDAAGNLGEWPRVGSLGVR